jgi:hypothetical protein
MIQLLLARYAVKIGLIVLVALGAEAAGIPVVATLTDLVGPLLPDWSTALPDWWP